MSCCKNVLEFVVCIFLEGSSTGQSSKEEEGGFIVGQLESYIRCNFN